MGELAKNLILLASFYDRRLVSDLVFMHSQEAQQQLKYICSFSFTELANILECSNFKAIKINDFSPVKLYNGPILPT